jgi:zinc transport system substrate-binding protein
LRGTRASIWAAVALFSVPSLAAEEEHWRLVVSDHGSPTVRVLDLDGTAMGTFETRGPSSLSVGPNGTTVYAIQTDANAVQAIDSGIALEDHGDHGDIEVREPKLLPIALEGDRPVHFVVHEGNIAVFYDGEGKARIFTEGGIAAGAAPREVDSGAPHHGVALTVGEHVVVSVPNAEDPSALPVGVRVVDAAGERVGEDHACPDLHGEASSGNVVALACATGILIVREAGSGAPEVRHVAYQGLPEGKSTTLLGGKGAQYFLGNYGAGAVVVIDPSVDTFTRIALPTRRVHFAVDPANPFAPLVFTEDGKLHKLDIVKGEIAQSVTVTPPYSMDGHWSDPRPRIAVADGHVFVTDPLAGAIHVLEAKSLSIEEKLAVGGKPFNVVAVGGAGEDHGHSHGHKH